MPRRQEVIRMFGPVWQVEVYESYSLRLDLPNGDVLRSDGKNLWFRNGCSWLGPPHKSWDESKAVPDLFNRQFESEVDYG
jgi:hypothetical protein